MKWNHKNNKPSSQRRDFLKKAVAGTFLFSMPVRFNTDVESGENNGSYGKLPDKVKTAMLSMQRASWEQGVAAQAILEWGDSNLTYLLAKEAVLRQTNEGRLSVLYTDNGVTDPAASGEAVYRMAIKTGEKELVQAHEKMLDYLLVKAPRTFDGIIYHTINSPEIWVDSIYMAPPYLSVAGHHAEALKQVEGIRKYLWNSEYNLYSHRWHVGEERFINESFWGVGNGWAVASLARIIDSLPVSMSEERNQLIRYELENINGCLKYMRPDGLFHNVLNDHSTFVETNLSQMLAYGIFRGIQSGWLDSEYLQQAEKMRAAAHSKVDEHGFVQDVCGAPYFNSPGRATEGQAFFILMEAARKKMDR